MQNDPPSTQLARPLDARVHQRTSGAATLRGGINCQHANPRRVRVVELAHLSTRVGHEGDATDDLVVEESDVDLAVTMV